jgi:hypothetical protein
MRKIYCLLITFIFINFTIEAQELNCKVSINTQKITQTANIKIFKTLEQSLNDFMNNTKWTNDVYKTHEKIECSILLQVEELKTKDGNVIENKFLGTLTIQSSRPVFNSDYKTTMLNWKDLNFSFTYKENDQLEYNENAYLNNITHTFAFYANIILGIDYDSYSLNGGTSFFTKAENLAQLAANSDDQGWKNNLNDRTRFNLITDIQASKYKAFREAEYAYHLKGIDIMYDDVVKARSGISQAINLLNGINTNTPNSILVQLFTQAKSNEIASIFDNSEKAERESVMKTMSKIDIPNSSKYQQIMLKSGGK